MSSTNAGMNRSYKASFNGKTTRDTLSTPLRLSDLHDKLRCSFNSITEEHDLLIQYQDEENDVITISTNEDLEVAASVFTEMRKIMRFSITALKKPPMPPSILPVDSSTDLTKQRLPVQEQVRIIKDRTDYPNRTPTLIIAYPAAMPTG